MQLSTTSKLGSRWARLPAERSLTLIDKEQRLGQGVRNFRDALDRLEVWGPLA